MLEPSGNLVPPAMDPRSQMPADPCIRQIQLSVGELTWIHIGGRERGQATAPREIQYFARIDWLPQGPHEGHGCGRPLVLARTRRGAHLPLTLVTGPWHCNVFLGSWSLGHGVHRILWNWCEALLLNRCGCREYRQSFGQHLKNHVHHHQTHSWVVVRVYGLLIAVRNPKYCN